MQRRSIGSVVYVPGAVVVLLMLPLVLLLFAGVVGSVAVVDHRRKQDRIESTQVANWECRHENLRCGSVSWRTMEARWERRQLSYELAVIGLSATATGLLAGMWRRGLSKLAGLQPATASEQADVGGRRRNSRLT